MQFFLLLVFWAAYFMHTELAACFQNADLSTCVETPKKLNSVAFSPQANYTD
jgi:hypothetical protein